MSNEDRQPIPPLDRKFYHYKPSQGELFASFVYYTLRTKGDFSTMPSGQQLIAQGLKTAAGNIPQLLTLLDTNGELGFEAREILDKLQKDGFIIEAEGRYQLTEKQKHTDTFASASTTLFTPEGIDLLRGAAAAAQKMWSTQKS